MRVEEISPRGAEEKQEENQAVRLIISVTGLFSVSGTVIQRTACLSQVSLTECSENNHKYSNIVCLLDTPSSLCLSRSLHLDYAPSCGQFYTAAG